MQKQSKNKQRGFTLVEVLVVISIIGMLSSIILTSFNTARKRGRDARRIADIRQLNTAIQLYINSNGHAPYVGTYNCSPQNAGDGSCNSVTEVNSDQWNELKNELSPFISKIPTDPCGVKCFSSSPLTFYAYAYFPPANVAWRCQNEGCPLSDSALDVQYSIFAETMEVSSSNYTGHASWHAPTFGYINHTLGGTSF